MTRPTGYPLALALVWFSATSGQAFGDETPRFEVVTPAWVADHAADPGVRVLDVRNSPYPYLRSHVPSAVHLADSTMRGPRDGWPARYVPGDAMGTALRRAGVTDSNRVVVYSDGREVLGATMVAYSLLRVGHRRVAVMDGGFTEYAENSKVTQRYPTYKEGEFTPKVDENLFVTLDDVKTGMKNPAVQFVDARSGEVFAGDVKIWSRNGHIPGAVNVPWTLLMDRSNAHKFRPKDDLSGVVRENGVEKDKELIVYCGTSREATLLFLTLKYTLGYPKVRLYEGSWTEYAATDLPVETGR